MNQTVFYPFKQFVKDNLDFKMEFKTRKNLNSIPHSHDNFQICYVSKGSCFHYVENTKSNLVKGDIFSIPPYQVHKLEVNKSDEINITQIDFMPNFISESAKILSSVEGFTDFIYIQPLLNSQNSLMPKLNLSAKNEATIEFLINSMLTELKFKEEGFELSIKADLIKMLIIISREFRKFISNSKASSESIKLYSGRFREIILDLENNYAKDYSLSELAQKANMSVPYFSHMFKIVTGYSVIEFINKVRVTKAADLLRFSDLSITEICFMVGYNNLGHFNKMFKRMIGTTPSYYRQKKLLVSS